jgi:hypothetical protein
VDLSKVLAAFIAAHVAAFGSCFAELRATLSHTPQWIAPAPSQLSQIGDVAALLALPPHYVPGSLVATLDGQDVSGAFSAGASKAQATLHISATGSHALHASVHLKLLGVDTARDADVSFTTVDLPNADQCEVLNALDCLLPYPSSRFEAPANTPTGLRLEFPEGLTPSIFNLDLNEIAPMDPAPYRALDGFSPAVQVLMHFPGNVDPVQSNASRLLPETRTSDLTSLAPNSPTLLIEADTGEQLLHFIELDTRAVDPSSGDPLPDQLVFLRPSEHLKHGKRYIVAVRHLVHPDGSAVTAEPAFAALRDGTPTTIAAIESRRPQFAKIFADLRRAGLSRRDLSQLVLAFDFTVASQENTTGEMLSMRDQAFAWLAGQTAPTFSVDTANSQEFDCSVSGQFLWRRVRGTFQVPLFLSSDPAVNPGTVGYLQLDPNGVPQSQGLENAPFTILVPCAAQATTGDPLRPVLIGHGLGQTGDGILQLVADQAGEEVLGSASFRNLLGATDWEGLAAQDFNGVFQLSGFLGSIFRDFDHFRALPDRLRQAQANTLVLARMMREGLFNSSSWFQRSDGSGVFPGPSEPEFYWGVSLGGIMGLFVAALTPDIERFNTDVAASNFSMLLSRSTDFEPLEKTLFGIFQPNVRVQEQLLGLIGELWTRGEPAGYVAHVTGLNPSAPPLPGSFPKKIMLTLARFDHQVSNQASEITARTMRLPSLIGSAEPGKPLIPDLPGPLDSAVIVYDPGGLVPGVDNAEIPPLAPGFVQDDQCDPHAETLTIPAQLDQLAAFLKPDGQLVNLCDGLCDGHDSRGNFLPYEIPRGAAQPCMPTPPP